MEDLWREIVGNEGGLYGGFRGLGGIVLQSLTALLIYL